MTNRKEILYSISRAYGMIGPSGRPEDIHINPRLSFERELVIDNYFSFIWTMRWRGYGDFELSVPYSFDAAKYLIEYSFIQWEKFPRVLMQIHEIENTFTPDEGPVIIVRGKSLECLLEDRVVWKQSIINDQWIEGVQQLIFGNCAWDPTQKYPIDNVDRIFPDFMIDVAASTYPAVQEDAQFTGDTVYDALDQICAERNVGFSCLFDYPNIKFNTYLGVERTNIKFTFENGDISSSRFIRLFDTYFNFAYVGGDGEGSSRKIVPIFRDEDGEGIWFNRHEAFLDQRNISSSGLTTAKYNAQLKQKGIDELNKAADTDVLEIAPTMTNVSAPIFNVDYLLGDIFEVSDMFGNAGKFRLVEMVISVDEADNYLATPTFINTKEEQT